MPVHRGVYVSGIGWLSPVVRYIEHLTMSEQRQNGLSTDGTIQSRFRGDSEEIQRRFRRDSEGIQRGFRGCIGGKVETFDENFLVEISSF